ncbi:uncharacterized protein LOC142767796 [Rhipicephalus microplus]|uniref:uncharacterized protein LOC142767796 n=1 Tax=Rhipicephalus microplus TaxID=6941 RepID=UPI003F6D67E0
MYQASLKPLPPNKPLPDETGFQNYFSPSPVGQNCYMPNYYFYPQAYPQPPPVYTLPPLPPAPVYAPASPEELDAFPVSAPPNSIDSRRPASNSSEVGQPALNFLLCGLLLFLVLLLFGLAIMMAYAMTGKPEDIVPRDTSKLEGVLTRLSYIFVFLL